MLNIEVLDVQPSSNATTPGPGDGVSTTLIIGVVVGVVGAVIIIIIVVVAIVLVRRSSK